MMSKFKEALERGNEASLEEEKADRGVDITDFSAQARIWLNDVVVASLEAANAEVAGEMTINIDTGPPRVRASAPSIRFQIHRKRGLGKKVRRTFTVSVQVGGEVAVSAPGMVAKNVGNIWERSDERFRNALAELIEDAAKST
jgi:hypothetical protein